MLLCSMTKLPFSGTVSIKSYDYTLQHELGLSTDLHLQQINITDSEIYKMNLKSLFISCL